LRFWRHICERWTPLYEPQGTFSIKVRTSPQIREGTDTYTWFDPLLPIELCNEIATEEAPFLDPSQVTSELELTGGVGLRLVPSR
jgi:hypothetical protein